MDPLQSLCVQSEDKRACGPEYFVSHHTAGGVQSKIERET